MNTSIIVKRVSFGLICLVAVGLGLWLSLALRTDFKTIDERSYRWDQFSGHYLVVNYFAEWCAPCLKEIPELNGFHDYANKQNDVSLFAVNFDNLDDNALKELQSKYKMQFNMVSGFPLNAPYAMPKTLPATFIIGRDGKVIKELKGEQTNQDLQLIIQQLRKL